ncbi:phosphoribosyltransferase family protein [Cellulomonas sp.]|uniref:ComF family protein n=1 Tax=Cellulomonas sp. TaxID=40001 RepID=UPI001B24F980|nr:phosphoribosyltransferase family protein [Cellulomonas sp.]MBO9555526.1 ComF family protein [Cellulomonas sp.]
MGPDLARALLGLVLPVACAGCDADDVPWCDACARLLSVVPWRCEQRAGRLDHLDGRAPLPVWTSADCVGPVRRAVVAWKDRGRADLTPTFRSALADAARATAATWPRRPGEVLLVVPAPSTAAARRHRGADLVGELARGVVEGTTGARLAPVLARRRGGDQVGLGVRERARNLHGQVVVRARGRRVVEGNRVLLVDDVLTTGATLAACTAALRDAGADVVGCLTLASTPVPGATRPRTPVALG